MDRIEGSTAVLLAEDARVFRSVGISQLPRGTEEGSILRIDQSPDGEPIWSTATLDEALRQEILDRGRGILRELRARDPGGDISL